MRPTRATVSIWCRRVDRITVVEFLKCSNTSPVNGRSRPCGRKWGGYQVLGELVRDEVAGKLGTLSARAMSSDRLISIKLLSVT